MADLSNTLSTIPLSTEEVITRCDLQQRDGVVAAIARRIRDNAVLPIERRCVKQTIRPLAFPVWAGGIAAMAVVTLYWLQPRPRKHFAERLWYESVGEARRAHPKAQLLGNPESVAPRLAPARA